MASVVFVVSVRESCARCVSGFDTSFGLAFQGRVYVVSRSYCSRDGVVPFATGKKRSVHPENGGNQLCCFRRVHVSRICHIFVAASMRRGSCSSFSTRLHISAEQKLALFAAKACDDEQTPSCFLARFSCLNDCDQLPSGGWNANKRNNISGSGRRSVEPHSVHRAGSGDRGAASTNDAGQAVSTNNGENFGRCLRFCRRHIRDADLEVTHRGHSCFRDYVG